LPIVQAQIKKFLSDHEINAEFSHTIIHSYQYKPPVPSVDEKEEFELPAISEMKSPPLSIEESKAAAVAIAKPFSQQRKEAAEVRRQHEMKEQEQLAMDIRAAQVQKAVDDAKAARAKLAVVVPVNGGAHPPPQSSARPPPSAARPPPSSQYNHNAHNPYNNNPHQHHQGPPPSSYMQPPSSARPPQSARPNGGHAHANGVIAAANLYVPASGGAGAGQRPGSQQPPQSSASRADSVSYGGYPWRENRPGGDQHMIPAGSEVFALLAFAHLLLNLQ
jgi:hypothetical protein